MSYTVILCIYLSVRIIESTSTPVLEYHTLNEIEPPSTPTSEDQTLVGVEPIFDDNDENQGIGSHLKENGEIAEQQPDKQEEWYSDEEEEPELFGDPTNEGDLRIGLDHLLYHEVDQNVYDDEIFPVDDDNYVEHETVNRTISLQSDSTNYDNITMDWETLHDQSILLGYGSNNKVELRPDYFKEFVQHLDLTEELKQINDDKFICSLEQFKHLIENISCQECGLHCTILKKRFVGSVLEITFTCKNGHQFKWASSPSVGNIYANNLQLVNSILMSGNMYIKISLFCKFLNLKLPSESTFYRFARLYAAPQIE